LTHKPGTQSLPKVRRGNVKHKSQTMLEVLSPELRVIADYACQTGENRLWHPLEKHLYQSGRKAPVL
jgi:hypothetical protein